MKCQKKRLAIIARFSQLLSFFLKSAWNDINYILELPWRRKIVEIWAFPGLWIFGVVSEFLASDLSCSWWWKSIIISFTDAMPHITKLQSRISRFPTFIYLLTKMTKIFFSFEQLFFWCCFQHQISILLFKIWRMIRNVKETNHFTARSSFQFSWDFNLSDR